MNKHPDTPGIRITRFPNHTMTRHETAPAHTPTPWDVDMHDGHRGSYRIAQAEDQLQELFDSGDEENVQLAYRIDDANARFITRACNAHAGLTEACSAAARMLHEAGDDMDRVMRARWRAIDVLTAAVADATRTVPASEYGQAS